MAREGKSPAFQFYAADWLADEDVRAMTLAERGAYIDLLAFCWREGSIPDDSDRCARLLGATAREFAGCWTAVRARFQPGEAGRLVSARMEQQRAEHAAYVEMQRQKGNKSAAARAAGRQPEPPPNGNRKSTAAATAVEPRGNSASASASAVEKPLARDAGGRVSSLWTAASLEQLWADTYRLPSSPGDLPDLSRMLATTGRARGEEPPAFAAAFLGAFRDMLADWKRRGKHHGAPTTEGAISHFAAAVAWLDEHKAPKRAAPDPDANPYADELARNREAAKHRAPPPPREAFADLAADPESWRYDEASRT